MSRPSSASAAAALCLCLCLTRRVPRSDISPNESHHVASAFAVMFERHNFVAHLPPAHVRLFRGRVIDLVLATDIAHHFSVVQAVRARDPSDMTTSDVPLILKVTMKTADLAHTFMDWEDHCLWSKMLQKELFDEGDLHRTRLGAQPPTIMDREACARGHTFESAQAGFFHYIVIPLLEALATFLPGSGAVLARAKANSALWETTAFRKTRSGRIEVAVASDGNPGPVEIV